MMKTKGMFWFGFITRKFNFWFGFITNIDVIWFGFVQMYLSLCRNLF